MWPFWGLELNRVRCDLLFTEAINQSMQVPNRLKVADGFSPVNEEPTTEDVPPSFRMHIPDRISLAEIMDTGPRPILLDQQRKVPSTVGHESSDSSVQPAALGELPFLRVASRSSTQKRKRSGHHSSRSRRERAPGDYAQLALHSPGQHHERLDTCPLPTRSAPLPLLTQTGRIYSVQNIFQTMCLLGQVLFHRVRDTLQDSVPSSSQETGPALESSLEEVGMAEMAAMRKQLTRISGRLQVLEEQCNGWRRKEALVYSVLISACLINTWLWLRR
ncbi:mitochondrial fission factor homolog B isoform X2 [Struthio camelus]|nr:PREDICTED: fetal and adult testis-expressed transcript protein isoform X1 [Struthio camelus australis]XP_009668231.1 PREDICTED: fetal and adult testis-expressed transcript protein isoform X1 [Struthio camelus australis]XP_009668232.1 PREDICTED: fetal and adult testis-expressed transcript protein isoform X1 [Struthio camelus australis]XP_009668234.1 PREDICTED: fetal and adult testis-expressed transcript protein isoform X1 [Struthio camelus australis]